MYRTANALTKSDTAIYSPPYSAFYVGVTGDVTVLDAYGNSALFKAVPAGVTVPCAITALMSTGTTATNVVGMR